MLRMKGDYGEFVALRAVIHSMVSLAPAYRYVSPFAVVLDDIGGDDGLFPESFVLAVREVCKEAERTFTTDMLDAVAAGFADGFSGPALRALVLDRVRSLFDGVVTALGVVPVGSEGAQRVWRAYVQRVFEPFYSVEGLDEAVGAAMSVKQVKLGEMSSRLEQVTLLTLAKAVRFRHLDRWSQAGLGREMVLWWLEEGGSSWCDDLVAEVGGEVEMAMELVVEAVADQAFRDEMVSGYVAGSGVVRDVEFELVDKLASTPERDVLVGLIPEKVRGAVGRLFGVSGPVVEVLGRVVRDACVSYQRVLAERDGVL